MTAERLKQILNNSSSKIVKFEISCNDNRCCCSNIVKIPEIALKRAVKRIGPILLSYLQEQEQLEEQKKKTQRYKEYLILKKEFENVKHSSIIVGDDNDGEY
jgi:DNA topoisomerase VI subunit B